MSGANNSEWPSRRWRTAQPDASKVGALVASAGVHPTLARCLVARGIDTPEAAARFLSPSLAHCVLPDEMPGVAAAAEIICGHVARKHRIVVFGDFDADGMTAASILSQAIERVGGDSSIFIPDRQAEGYGFTTAALERCLDETPDVRLVVSVDCGISQSDACDEAVASGVEVIITDHHQMTEPVPSAAAAVVNPKLPGTPPALEHLCGAGVAFKLAHQIARIAMAPEDGRALVCSLLPLAAIGTVADLVPLLDENRVIVVKGLERMNSGDPRCCPGIAALKQVAGVVGDATASNLGFALAPRINAAGRVGDPDTAVRLMNSQSQAEAGLLAQQLERDNDQRRQEEIETIEKANALVPDLIAKHPHSIVLHNDEWHPGVIGLVASRLVSRHRLPAVVITGGGNDGLARGSARCPEHESLDLMPILQACAHLLGRYGGHRVAAGLSLPSGNIEEFRAAFDEACAKAIAGLDLRPELLVDDWISPDAIGGEMESLLGRLEPCGMDNPSPKLGVRGLTLSEAPRSFGKKRQDNWAFTFAETDICGIAFRKDGVPFRAGDKLDVVFAFSRNMYGELQIIIRDAALSS